MKKSLAALILIFSVCFVDGQNLVSNWSFEDTLACPIGIGQIDFAAGWSSYGGSPDYLNSCNTSNVGSLYAGVPGNYFGFQNAKTGVAYAGLYTFSKFATNAREILGAELNQALTIGQRYYIAFYVNRATNNNPSLNIDIGTNKLGVRFSTVSYSFSNPIPIDNSAQVYTDSVISDTLNWTKISGSFIADSSYLYFSIGNFFTDSATTHVSFDTLAASAYYYIDDVRISSDSNFVNGISDHVLSNLIKIFPNPARDFIVVEGRCACKLSIYDILGNPYFSTNVSLSSFVRVDITSFSKGIYFLRLESPQENISQKLIIQ